MGERRMNREAKIKGMIKSRQDAIDEVKINQQGTLRRYGLYREEIGYDKEIEIAFGRLFNLYEDSISHRETAIEKLKGKL